MIRKEENRNIVSMKMPGDCMLHLSWLSLIYKLVYISLQCDAIRMLIWILSLRFVICIYSSCGLRHITW